jgi:catechol 2,3-dioxygenase-like lactoylglutathione lyase family enzyme
MIAHTSLPVTEYTAAKRFYIRALAPRGYSNHTEPSESAGFNEGTNTDFWLFRSDTVVPQHVAFVASSRAEVEAFHRAAIEAGAADNGGPGYRDYWPGYYAAFVLDADGHNVEAVWYDYGRAEGD